MKISESQKKKKKKDTNLSILKHTSLEEIETAERSISDARYNADDVRDSARNLECDIEALLIEYVKEEKEDKTPAVKLTANKGDSNAQKNQPRNSNT